MSDVADDLIARHDHGRVAQRALPQVRHVVDQVGAIERGQRDSHAGLPNAPWVSIVWASLPALDHQRQPVMVVEVGEGGVRPGVDRAPEYETHEVRMSRGGGTDTGDDRAARQPELVEHNAAQRLGVGLRRPRPASGNRHAQRPSSLPAYSRSGCPYRRTGNSLETAPYECVRGGVGPE